MTTNVGFVDLLLKRVGDRKATQFRTQAVLEINNYIVHLEGGDYLPRFRRSLFGPLAVTAGFNFVNLEDEFIRETEDRDVVIDIDGEAVPLKKMVFDELQKRNKPIGTPCFYAIESILDLERLYLAPIPEKDYEIFVPYYRRSDPFIDNGANVEGWIKHAPNWIMGGAGRALARFHLQNKAMAQEMAGLIIESRAHLISSEQAIEDTNTEHEMEE